MNKRLIILSAIFLIYILTACGIKKINNQFTVLANNSKQKLNTTNTTNTIEVKEEERKK